MASNNGLLRHRLCVGLQKSKIVPVTPTITFTALCFGVFLILWIGAPARIWAQQPSLNPPDTAATRPDTTVFAISPPDSAATTADTVLANGLRVKDAIDQEVKLQASDSMVFDVPARKMYLYSRAPVSYTHLTLPTKA
jgi:hypothetical protein